MSDFYQYVTSDAPMSRSAIREQSLKHRELSAEEIARAVVSALPAEAVRGFAESWVATQVESVRREEARRIEEEATRPALEVIPEVRQEVAWQHRPWKEKPDHAVPALFVNLRDNPPSIPTLHDKADRMNFRKWMDDRFDGWYERARASVVETGDEVELHEFEAKWDPRGRMAYEAENPPWHCLAYQEFMSKIRGSIEQFAQSIRLELTQELLNTEFALGDGVRVTWGNATVEQHQKRAEMLTGNATANAEAAARHIVAVRMIEEAGKPSLAAIASMEGDSNGRQRGRRPKNNRRAGTAVAGTR